MYYTLDSREQYRRRLSRYYNRLAAAQRDREVPVFDEEALEQFLVELRALVERSAEVEKAA